MRIFPTTKILIINDNLTKTDFRSTTIFSTTKILINDNLTKTNFLSMIIFPTTKIQTVVLYAGD